MSRFTVLDGSASVAWDDRRGAGELEWVMLRYFTSSYSHSALCGSQMGAMHGTSGPNQTAGLTVSRDAIELDRYELP